MSHYMTALAMKQVGLKPATKIVLYWIADHHNGETGQCNPSISRLAKCCEMSRRSVEAHISTLEDKGLVSRRSMRRDQGGKTSNEYTLHIIQPDAQNLRMGSAKSAHGDAQNLRMKNLGNTNLGKEPTPKPPKGGEDGFNAFWAEVPRKVAKGNARKAYRSALKKAAAQSILDGMKRYSASVKGKDPKYIAHPATWLNGERWTDQDDTIADNRTWRDKPESEWTHKDRQEWLKCTL